MGKKTKPAPPVSPYVAERLQKLQEEGAIPGEPSELEAIVARVNERDVKTSKKARR